MPLHTHKSIRSRLNKAGQPSGLALWEELSCRWPLGLPLGVIHDARLDDLAIGEQGSAAPEGSTAVAAEVRGDLASGVTGLDVLLGGALGGG